MSTATTSTRPGVIRIWAGSVTHYASYGRDIAMECSIVETPNGVFEISF